MQKIKRESKKKEEKIQYFIQWDVRLNIPSGNELSTNLIGGLFAGS
jgi:hypothetical protein